MKNSNINSFDQLPLTLTVSDVKNLMGISLSKSYELTKIKGFPSIHIGKRIVIPKKAFEEWLYNYSYQEDFYEYK